MGDSPPPHPGLLLRSQIFDAHRLSISQAAQDMGVTRQTLHRILKGQAAVTADMALRIGRLSGTDAAVWLDLQQRHDLWQAKRLLAPTLATIPARLLPGQTPHIMKDADV